MISWLRNVNGQKKKKKPDKERNIIVSIEV